MAANFHVVYARTGPGRLGCFIVEPGTPGVSAQPCTRSDSKGCGLGQVTFDRVAVPDENVLGLPRRGDAVFQGAIERERACIARLPGDGVRPAEMAIECVNERRIGDSRLPADTEAGVSIALPPDTKLRLELLATSLHPAPPPSKVDGRRRPGWRLQVTSC